MSTCVMNEISGINEVITRGFPPPESDLASLFLVSSRSCAKSPSAQVRRGGCATWSQARRRAATALAIAISTPIPKISVPMTLTCGGIPVLTAPTIHSGNVTVDPLTKLVTT